MDDGCDGVEKKNPKYLPNMKFLLFFLFWIFRFKIFCFKIPTHDAHFIFGMWKKMKNGSEQKREREKKEKLIMKLFIISANLERRVKKKHTQENCNFTGVGRMEER